MERALPIVPASDVGVIPTKRNHTRHRCEWSTCAPLRHVERLANGVSTLDVGFVRCRECGEFWKVINSEDSSCGSQWLRRGEQVGKHKFSKKEYEEVVLHA